MAGIYIPSMEMPNKKNGAVIIIYPQGVVMGEEHTLYQAIAVPDHGGLIDRIALLNALPDDYRIPNKAAKVLENVIIPADKE